MTTEESILGSIARFVFRYGFSSLTMQNAAEYARVSKRTLYKQFPNKESLLNATFDFQISRVAVLLSSIARDDSHPCLVKLSTAFSMMADFIRHLSPVLMRDMLQNDSHYWDRVQRIRQERIYPLIVALLLQARTEGLIRPGIEPGLLTGMLFSAIEATANPTSISRLPFEPQTVFENLFNILFFGILADEGRQRIAQSGTIPYHDALEALF
ncbi:MAG TPA: TetR/AcrR family transcriptional regulator [bacterium]|nr:TetR/AcrR family transcriptional regulator [bacterium]